MFKPLIAADIVDTANMVAPLPYINFLRYFKRKHPRFGTRRLLQEAVPQWDALTEGQKNLFKKHRILARTSRCNQKRRRRLLLHRCKVAPQRKLYPVRRPIYAPLLRKRINRKGRVKRK